MPQREEFSHDIRDVHEENKDREQLQSEEQNETIEIEKEERQTEHQNEEECSKNIEQNSNKNNVNDSGGKPKRQSNKKNGKSGSIKASDNEASINRVPSISCGQSICLCPVCLHLLHFHSFSQLKIKCPGSRHL
jgi:hypothetical protein